MNKGIKSYNRRNSFLTAYNAHAHSVNSSRLYITKTQNEKAHIQTDGTENRERYATRR